MAPNPKTEKYTVGRYGQGTPLFSIPNNYAETVLRETPPLINERTVYGDFVNSNQPIEAQGQLQQLQSLRPVFTWSRREPLVKEKGNLNLAQGRARAIRPTQELIPFIEPRVDLSNEAGIQDFYATRQRFNDSLSNWYDSVLSNEALSKYYDGDMEALQNDAKVIAGVLNDGGIRDYIYNYRNRDSKLSDKGKLAFGALVGNYSTLKPNYDGYYGWDNTSVQKGVPQATADAFKNASDALDQLMPQYTTDSSRPSSAPVFYTDEELRNMSNDEYMQKSTAQQGLKPMRGFGYARGGSMPTQKKKPTKPSPEWIKNQYGIMAHIAPGYSNDEWDVYI